MLRFHVNQRPDLDFIEVKKRVECCQVAQIGEPFEVGTSSGIAKGNEGDYLLMDKSSLSVVLKEDFETLYEVVKPKASKKKAVAKNTVKPTTKKVVKKKEGEKKKEAKQEEKKKSTAKAPTSKKKAVAKK